MNANNDNKIYLRGILRWLYNDSLTTNNNSDLFIEWIDYKNKQNTINNKITKEIDSEERIINRWHK